MAHRRSFLPLLAWLLPIVLLAGCASKPHDRARPAINEQAFTQLVGMLCDPLMEGRGAGTDGLMQARDQLVALFIRAGLEPAFVIEGEPSYTQPFDLGMGKDDKGEPITTTVYNVGGLLPGEGELANEVVVVGAHYDHVGRGYHGSRSKYRKGSLHPGADDNASGTAGVVLLARDAATYTGTDLPIRGEWPTLEGLNPRGPPEHNAPRRTIMFTCFAGEERGLHGSRYMTKNPDQYAFDPQQISGMINMDMIGRVRDNQVDIYTDATGKQWRDWTRCENKAVGLTLGWDKRAPGGSDHSLFIAAGVPAVFFNTGLHDDYHTPDDTPDTLNAPGSVRVLTLVAGLLERTATQDDRLVFVKPPAPKPRPVLGVQLGEHGQGVKVESVVDDGPMQQAGGRAGDLIVAIAGKPIKSMGDIRGFLSKASPDQMVVVTVLREDEAVKLTVKLGKR